MENVPRLAEVAESEDGHPGPSGPRQFNRLASTTLGRLPAGKHADGGGLVLWVRSAATPAKGRSWIVRTMVRDGNGHPRRTDISIGPYPKISLADARKAAAALQEAARGGRDPVAERETARQPVAPKVLVTFEAYAERFIEARRPSWKNAVLAAQWPATLKAYAYPVIGSTPVADVSPSQVREIMQPIWSAKPDTAKKVAQRIGAVIDAAIAEELRTRANPTRGLKQLLGPQKAVIEHHEALPWAQTPAFMAWLHRECPSAPLVRLAMEWLLLTGTRVRETLDAPWTEIDGDKAVWRIARPRMKRPCGENLPHEVPLPSRALDILDAARRLQPDGCKLVFADGRGKPLSTNTFRMMLRRGGYSATAHGFRATLRGWASERWVSPVAEKGAVIEAALDHVPGKVERAYHRSRYLEERASLMQDWSDYISGASASGKVLAFPKAVAG